MARNIMATTALAMFFTALTAGSGEEPGLARAIMRETGIGGGLCVHLGCDDGVLAVKFAQTGKFLVHGWCTDATALAKARGAIQAKGVYGQASVDRSSLARLPYADSLVNLVVVDDLAAAHLAALERLTPGRPLVLNLGTGRGYSVREVIDACRKVTGREIAVREGPRRPVTHRCSWPQTRKRGES